MSISLVNGYLCTNCADAARARRGEDPHPSPVKERQEAERRDRLSGTDGAVVFGGGLATLKTADNALAGGAVAKAPVLPLAVAQKVDFYA